MNIFPSKNCYIGLLILAILEVIWLVIAGHTIDFSSLVHVLNGLALFLGGVVVLHFIEPRFRQYINKTDIDFQKRYLSLYLPITKNFIEGMIFMLLGWIVLRLLNHLTMTIPIPYADPFLVSLDTYIPLDWNKYFEFVARTPLLIDFFDIVYTKLTDLSVIGFIILLFCGRIEQARYFVITFTVTAIICTLIGMFFPALAAVEYSLENKDLLNNFPYAPGVYSVEILERLRSGDSLVFNFNYLPGLTTFPSFHTAAGIVLLYAFRQTLMFWPILLYVISMIASTPIYGGHYFSDLIFGTAIAVIICNFVERKWFPNTFKKSIDIKSKVSEAI